MIEQAPGNLLARHTPPGTVVRLRAQLRQVKTNNPLERIIREIRRHMRVVGAYEADTAVAIAVDRRQVAQMVAAAAAEGD